MVKMNLTEAEREEPLSMQRSRTMAIGQVGRARLILRGLARGDHERTAMQFAFHYHMANPFCR